MLYSGDAAGLAAAADGRVWTLRDRSAPPPDVTVVSAVHFGQDTEYRLTAEHEPSRQAQPAVPGLEDGYMALMRRYRQAASDGRLKP